MNAKMRKFSIVWVWLMLLCCVKMTDLHIQVFQLQDTHIQKLCRVFV